MYYQIISLVNDINKHFGLINQALLNMQLNPFKENKTPIIVNKKILALIKKTSELEKKRLSFNESIDNIKDIKNRLITLNLKKNAYELFSKINLYNESNNKVKTIDSLTNQLDEVNKKLNNLKASNSNVKIALEGINKLLHQIFLYNKNVRLELSRDNKYIIKINEKPVSLKDLSTGEQNIIALCYFFNLLNENNTKNELYKKDYFIVLDDPICSLDYNNQDGIYTLIYNIISSIFKNNDNSKILILTHQRETFKDLSMFLKQDSLIKKNLVCSILENKEINKFDNEFNLYKIIINELYTFINDSKNYEQNKLINIPNMLRRALEAFNSFTSGKKFYDENILNAIDNNVLKDYLLNSLKQIRLVVNSGSHSLDEFTNPYQEDNFILSRDGELRKVKDGLLLIYLLNKYHLLCMLNIKECALLEKHKEEILESQRNF